jgi:hypothetical protein
MLRDRRVPTVCAVHILLRPVHILLPLCTNMHNFSVILLLFRVPKLLQLICVVMASCSCECVPFTVLSIVFRVA